MSRFQADPQLWLYAACAAVLLACSVLIMVRERGRAVARLHVTFIVTLLIWCAVRAAMRAAVDMDLLMRLGRYEYALTAIASAQLYLAFLRHFVSEQRDQRIVNVTWAIAVIMAALAVASPWFITGTVVRPWGFEIQLGPAGLALLLWQLLMILSLDVQLSRALRQAASETLERQRLRGLVWVLALLHIAPMDMFHDLTGWLYPASVITVPVFAVALTYFSLRHSLLDLSLSRLSASVLDQFDEGVVVLSPTGRVRQLNPRAAAMLGCSSEQALALGVGELFRDALRLGTVERLGASDGRSTQSLSLADAQGRPRNLRLRVLASRDRHQRLGGWICELQDLTATVLQARQREERERHDPLTGLLSRAGFRQALQQLLPAGGDAQPISAVLLAATRYRSLKGAGRQAAGEEALVQLAEVARELAGDGGLASRYGDDELLVLMPPGLSAEQLDARLQSRRAPLPLHAAIGVVPAPAAGQRQDSLLRQVSAVRDLAEQQIGHPVWLPEQEAAASRHLESELRTALQQQQLVLYYQPVVAGPALEIVGFEALIRWQHPQRGLIFPGDFIDFAEEIGLGPAIDDYVVARAAQDVVTFRALAPEAGLRINVNISQQRMEHPDAIRAMLDLVVGQGAQPSFLQLEVLERAALDAEGLARLHALARAGFRLCIDDFGTGYSSLSRLIDLPARTVKIDRSFIQALERGEDERLVHNIVSIAGELGLATIAEGVEREQEIRKLLSMGCRYFQGFHISRAVPLEVVVDWLKQGGGPWAALPENPAVAGDSRPAGSAHRGD